MLPTEERSQMRPEVAKFICEKIEKHQKGITASLGIITALAAITFGVGLLRIGHQKWWNVPNLSKFLTEAQGLHMMTIGSSSVFGVGILFGISCINLYFKKKNNVIPDNPSDSTDSATPGARERIDTQPFPEDVGTFFTQTPLPLNSWTVIQDKDGFFVLHKKVRQDDHDDEGMEQTSDNISSQNYLAELSQWKDGCTFVKTNIDATATLLPMTELDVLLQPGQYTIVPQINGNYALMGRLENNTPVAKIGENHPEEGYPDLASARSAGAQVANCSFVANKLVRQK